MSLGTAVAGIAASTVEQNMHDRSNDKTSLQTSGPFSQRWWRGRAIGMQREIPRNHQEWKVEEEREVRRLQDASCKAFSLETGRQSFFTLALIKPLTLISFI